jgi:hypothetical protein
MRRGKEKKGVESREWRGLRNGIKKGCSRDEESKREEEKEY